MKRFILLVGVLVLAGAYCREPAVGFGILGFYLIQIGVEK